MRIGLSAKSLLPHLDALDVQTGIVSFAPGWKPLLLCAPEIASCGFADVDPWFGTYAVSVFRRRLVGCHLRTDRPGRVAGNLREISILSSNSQIQDEVELLVEGRIQVSATAPWILHQGSVGGVAGEFTALPHALLAFEGPIGYLLLGVVGG